MVHATRRGLGGERMKRAPRDNSELRGALLAAGMLVVNGRWLIGGGGPVALVGTVCGAVALVMWLARPWLGHRRPDGSKGRWP